MINILNLYLCSPRIRIQIWIPIPKHWKNLAFPQTTTCVQFIHFIWSQSNIHRFSKASTVHYSAHNMYGLSVANTWKTLENIVYLGLPLRAKSKDLLTDCLRWLKQCYCKWCWRRGGGGDWGMAEFRNLFRPL